MLRDRMFRRGPAAAGGAPGDSRSANEVGRIEGLSDGVFAFAVTLLVVSLEVPRTFDELLAAMRGFVAFGLAFALLLYIWHRQYVFFRRYALADAWTLTFNGVLLFVVLFFVYPLKFLSTLMVDEAMGLPVTVQLAGGAMVARARPEQAPAMMEIYGLGYAAVFAVFALLYLHAHRRRGALGLGPLQALDARESIGENALHACVALTSVAIAALGARHMVGAAGCAYFLLAPLLTLHGTLMGRRRRRLEVALGEPAADRSAELSPGLLTGHRTDRQRHRRGPAPLGEEDQH